LIKEVNEESTTKAAIAELIEEGAEDSLAGQTCLPGDAEDDDSLVGPRGGSGLPGAPPADVGYPDLRLDDHGEEDDDDDELHEGCADDNMTVRFIDMGKGTSILLTAPNSETMLIDAGDFESGYGYENVKDAIEEDVCECRGPGDTYVIDHFVLSHDDEDHTKYISNLKMTTTSSSETGIDHPFPQMAGCAPMPTKSTTGTSRPGATGSASAGRSSRRESNTPAQSARATGSVRSTTTRQTVTPSSCS